MTEPPYPVVPGEYKKSWLERNALLKIPLGCLALLLLGVILVGGLLAVVTHSFRHSDVYRQAVQAAEQNPEVGEVLGKPLKPGRIIAGHLSVSGSTGNADLSIPISGPRGKGRIRAIAEKSEGVWRFSFLKLYVDGSDRSVDLLAVQASPERDF